MKESFTLVLEGERPPSWNEIYESKHWIYRKQMVDRIHTLVKYTLLLHHKGIEPFLGRVDITMTVYFKNRPLDADNICDKPYIDALKGIVIVNDNPKFVRSACTIPEIDAQRPRVELEVREV